jgi:hypothetical protein
MINNSGKLPRGSFYYIQIEQKYYAGEESIFLTSNASYENRIKLKLFTRSKHRSKYVKKDQKTNIFQPLLVRQLVGHRSLLVNEFSKSKKFRRLKQATSVYSTLARVYNGIAKPKIGVFYEYRYYHPEFLKK